ncbi:unnamed protein product [Closterium sp. NIES-64]|nr:unnamed protein product [Closterium sp. NIES-64]
MCSSSLSSCSRLHRLSRRTPHSLNFFFVSPFQYRNVRSFLKAFDDFSRVFTHIISLSVEVCSIRGSELLAKVGASCPKLERLKLVAKWGDFHMKAAAWTKLAKQCPLVASLELDSPFVRRPIIYPHSTGTPLPPIHSFALLITASKLNPLTCCSSLTSLTLWNPLPSTLSSLASSSSSSSSVRASLKSLTLHSAKLQSCLAPLASFPHLASLAFLACTIDPFDLHALACSLHTLTHLTIHDCPLVSSHALAALVEANPALASLALHGTTNHLFSAPPFRSLLLLSSPRLHTLDLSGLPSFRPGMLAPCSGLHSLALTGMPEELAAPGGGDAESRSGEGRGGGEREGEGEGGGTMMHQHVSFESFVGLLVRVVQRGGEGGEAGWDVERDGGVVGEAGRWEECEAEEVGRGKGASEATMTADAALARVGAAGPAAEARAVNPRSGERRVHVDVRTAAAAARADLIESSGDVVALLDMAQDCHTTVPCAAHWARLARAQRQDALSEIKYATGKIRAGISTWRALRVAASQKIAATEREDALSEAFAAATTAGVLVDTWSRVGEGEGGSVRLEDFDGMVLDHDFDGMVLDHDLPADGADGAEGSEDEGEIGGFAAGVDTQAHALGVMESLLQQFYEQGNAATESLRTMRMPRNARGANARGANARGANARGANARGANARGANARGANARGANARGANARGGNARGANARGGNARGGNARGANAKGGNARGANARGANARGANARGANARGANARGANARGANARGANARGANARGGNARGANARGGNARGANARGANARGANARGGNARGANARGANARGANARGGNARGGNARGANAKGGNARGANARGANARGANARGGNARGANARGANARGANARGANARGANARGA